MNEVVAEVPPRAHARIVYLGPVSPHWEVYGDWGDRTVLDEFRARVLARLVLLPRDDPQFRRNRERVVRDAEREAISLEWDLGVPDEGCRLQSRPNQASGASRFPRHLRAWTTASSIAS
jgi:hypothetical protein